VRGVLGRRRGVLVRLRVESQGGTARNKRDLWQVRGCGSGARTSIVDGVVGERTLLHVHDADVAGRGFARGDELPRLRRGLGGAGVSSVLLTTTRASNEECNEGNNNTTTSNAWISVKRWDCI
jgi:hypothetical protein